MCLRFLVVNIHLKVYRPHVWMGMFPYAQDPPPKKEAKAKAKAKAEAVPPA